MSSAIRSVDDYNRAHPTKTDRYYGTIVPSILNVLSMQGYLIVNAIIGGQTLAEVSSNVSSTLGIVIIAVTSLVVRLPSPCMSQTAFLTSDRVHIAHRSPSAAAKSSTGA